MLLLFHVSTSHLMSQVECGIRFVWEFNLCFTLLIIRKLLFTSRMFSERHHDLVDVFNVELSGSSSDVFTPKSFNTKMVTTKAFLSWWTAVVGVYARHSCLYLTGAWGHFWKGCAYMLKKMYLFYNPLQNLRVLFKDLSRLIKNNSCKLSNKAFLQAIYEHKYRVK